MAIMIAFLGLVVATILASQMLGSVERIPLLTCALAIFGFAMVVRGNNFGAAWSFIAAPLPIIRIRNKEKAQLWHDLQGQEAGQEDWYCPDFYDPRDWDWTIGSNDSWRSQDWWDG